MKNYNRFYYNHLKLINNLLKIAFIINFIIFVFINEIMLLFICFMCGFCYLCNEIFKENYEKLNKI